MAYQGRKVFVAGQVLTASDVNSTVDQTVMVFADAAARDLAIPTPTEGMVVYLESDNSLSNFTGASFVSLGVPTLTIDKVVISDGSGNLAASATESTELAKLEFVTKADIVTDATTARTLSVSDVGKTIIFTSGSAITLTVDDTSGFAAGQRVDIIQDGAGVLTITASTATVAAKAISTTTGSFTMGDQFEAATILCKATDSYLLIGNVVEV